MRVRPMRNGRSENPLPAGDAMMPLVRSLSPTDAPIMAAVHAVSFEVAWSADTFGDWLSHGPYVAYGRFDGASLLGFALFRKIMDEAELITVATSPCARKKGVAKNLLQECVTRLRIDGIKAVHLEVAEGNMGACALYRALGATQVGRRKGYYQGQDALLMRLCL